MNGYFFLGCELYIYGRIVQLVFSSANRYNWETLKKVQVLAYLNPCVEQEAWRPLIILTARERHKTGEPEMLNS